MSTTVYDVHHRNRQCVSVCTTDITIQRNVKSVSGSVCYGQGNTEDGVGAELALCRSAVEFEHLVVDGALLKYVPALKCRSDDIVHVGNSLEDTLSTETVLVAVAELESLVLAGRCA